MSDDMKVKKKDKKKKKSQGRTREQGRNLMKHAEREGLEVVATKVPGETMLQMVPVGVDPLTGRALADKLGRPPEKQGGRPVTSMTPKQLRARARRRGHMTDEEMAILYKKPISEWDMEELAAGRPKSKKGQFNGPAPAWIDRKVQEEIAARFKVVIKGELSKLSIPALQALEKTMASQEVDSRGRPMVPASVRVDIAKFILEHAVGKPEQTVKEDINVRLSGILAMAMVNPDPGTGDTHSVEGLPGYVTAALSAPLDIVDVDEIDEDDRSSGDG